MYCASQVRKKPTQPIHTFPNWRTQVIRCSTASLSSRPKKLRFSGVSCAPLSTSVESKLIATNAQSRRSSPPMEYSCSSDSCASENGGNSPASTEASNSLAVISCGSNGALLDLLLCGEEAIVGLFPCRGLAGVPELGETGAFSAGLVVIVGLLNARNAVVFRKLRPVRLLFSALMAPSGGKIWFWMSTGMCAETSNFPMSSSCFCFSVRIIKMRMCSQTLCQRRL
mmetsp:Transcript_55928/g.98052  ORF Transcript_55928/g.98052 Transcript_55928/m.98052 type:complete len:226 (-) Transcript_55928:762-1439(-)